MGDPRLKRKGIFLVGDSIAIHYSPWLRDALGPGYQVDTKVGLLDALSDLDDPRGMNCGDSDMVLAYVRERLGESDFQPDLIVINCGLHDIKTDPATLRTQVPIARYRANLEAIFRAILLRHLRFLWVRSTPIDEEKHNRLSQKMFRSQRDLEDYNRAADGLAAGHPVADLHGFTLRQPGELYCDHAHFTDRIRALQGAFLAGHIAILVPTSPAIS